jgi:hypothetical protein
MKSTMKLSVVNDYSWPLKLPFGNQVTIRLNKCYTNISLASGIIVITCHIINLVFVTLIFWMTVSSVAVVVEMEKTYLIKLRFEVQ